MAVDKSVFYQAFFTESFDGLEAMESDLLGIDLNTVNVEIFEEFFRINHVIKGGSASFEFSEVAEFSHVFETLIEKVRVGACTVSEELVQLCISSIDCCRKMLIAVQEEKKIDLLEVEAIQNQIETLLQRGTETSTVLTNSSESEHVDPEIVETNSEEMIGWSIKFRPFDFRSKTNDDLMSVFKALTLLGKYTVEVDASNLPLFESLTPDVSYLSWMIRLKGDVEKEKIDDVFNLIDGKCELEIKPILEEETVEYSEAETVVVEVLDGESRSTEVVVESENFDNSSLKQLEDKIESVSQVVTDVPDQDSMNIGIDIDAGMMKISLNMTAVKDSSGVYIGNLLACSTDNDKETNEPEAVLLYSVIENISTPVMIVNRDFVVTYTNVSAIEFVKSYQHDLKGLYPNFNTDELLGSSVEFFLEELGMSRNFLSEENNFRAKVDIDLGPIKLGLKISTIVDNAGHYLGCSLEWVDVADKNEDILTLLQGAVDNSVSALMMIDRTLKVTYANQSIIDLIEKYESVLNKVCPEFNGNELLGFCIERFNRNPEMLKNLLDNPANLPYRTVISAGEMKLVLNISAVLNKSDDYVGNCLEWQDVSELQGATSEISPLDGAHAV